MAAPVHCRPQAYARFAAEVERLEEPDALLRAAVAVSLHGMPEADVEAVEARLGALAARVLARAASGLPTARLAWLHEVLFEEEGYLGRAERSFHPEDSYLPAVLVTRRGLPITLALLYREVGRRVGLRVEGVNAPGHFLARVTAGGAPLLVDPHGGGRVLLREEAFRRMDEAVGTPVHRSPAFLRRATPHRWLARILQNLQAVFAHRGQHEDVHAMLEMRAVLLEATRRQE